MTLISRLFAQLAYRRGNIRNALYPSAGPWAEMVKAENHLTAFRHREVYRRAWELGTNVGATGSNTVGRFRFRTGIGVTTLTYVAIIGRDQAASATNPYLQIDTTISGGATSTTLFHYGLSSAVGTDGPDELLLVTEDVPVTASTVYEVAIVSVDYARIRALVAYEQAALTVDEATNYYNTQSPTASTPIYDADRQRIVQGLNDMWKRNRAACWHFHMLDGSARTRTSATYINILDNSTTGTPATSDYGFYLDLTSHNTLSSSTVPCELAVYGSVGGGAGGNVRLISSAGTTYGPVTVTGAAGWYTAAVNLPASSTFYTCQYAGDGAAPVTVNAVSLIEYTP